MIQEHLAEKLQKEKEISELQIFEQTVFDPNDKIRSFQPSKYS